MASTVRLNRRGMAALLNAPGVRDDLTRRASRVEAAAKASAPVESGAYRNSIHVVQDTTDRAVVRVVAESDHGLVVEANTGTLKRALDAAGGQ